MLLAAITLALAAGGCGGSGVPAVRTVATFPWPEGPGEVVASTEPVPEGITHVPLRTIQDLIPSTLPANPMQTCGIGAMVKVTLANGEVLTYGPCDRPPSIERLREALIEASRRD